MLLIRHGIVWQSDAVAATASLATGTFQGHKISTYSRPLGITSKGVAPRGFQGCSLFVLAQPPNDCKRYPGQRAKDEALLAARLLQGGDLEFLPRAVVSTMGKKQM